MCGIAGFYGFRNDDLIKKFSKQLAHRGPDGEGFYIKDNITLLNRRLAIIDRKSGDQPIYNEDGSIVIVFVGEIYNYLIQREKLINLGHNFKTKSDTEVVIHAYEEWGEKSFDKHNGMFTFALYDSKKNKLLLVRDHFGIKPLYYSKVKNGLVFSSEIKPIFHSGLIKKKPNDRIIYRYLRYRIHDDNKETFFAGISRLMPGELIEIQNSTFKIRKYTKLEDELIKLSSSPSIETKKEIVEFKKRLINSVRMRLIAEVPVGTCLSGGLDSSTVVALINKLLKEKVSEAQSVGNIQKTFSAVFPGSSNDEEEYIDELIKNLKLKTENFKVYPKAEDFFKEINDFLTAQEEPLISPGHYAQYKVMQKAHQYVTVVLDGQGSDEMMAGYLPYYYVYLNQLLKQKKYFTFAKETIFSIDIILKMAIRRFIRILGIKEDINPLNLLNEKYSKRFSNEKLKIVNDNLKKRLIQDIFYNSVQSLLRYEDRNAMHFSIEGRVPFLDFDLLNYLFSLPDEAIIKNGWNKYILRQSISDLLPDKIRNRRNKIGFTTPDQEWFLRMKNKIYQIFLSESFYNRKYFNQPEVTKKFQQFIEGKNEDTMLFWRILNLELWLRLFFDKPKSAHGGYQLGKANDGKKIELTVGKRKYYRYPLKTDLFKQGDNLINKIMKSLFQFNIKLENDEKEWFVVISEKIVAISQGRSYFIWDITPGFWAKTLSKFVTRTPYGIGLGSPWTMQLAIKEKGLTRIILATIVSGLTKPLGIKGLFYRIAGKEVASIDGPTEYSLYPSNVSAKLGPKDPEKVTIEIHNEINSKFKIRNSKFLGAVIIDANDLGRNVLGNSTKLSNKLIEEIFSDNPMGQSDEQTPIVIVFTAK